MFVTLIQNNHVDTRIIVSAGIIYDAILAVRMTNRLTYRK
jgi:hypothetical protein